MKNKISILLIVILFLMSTSAWSAELDKQQVRFVYINGSNNNTEKDRRIFYDGMQNMHPFIKKAFESDSYTAENFLEKGNYSIVKEPKIFFWGYDSSNAYVNMKTNLFALNMISPKIAQAIRSTIAGVIHDAVWVQKEKNMQKIVNDLHEDVMTAYDNNEKVVLFGHSAGSFVTYRYLFHKLPAISNESLISNLEKNEDGKIDRFYKNHPMKSTCIDAITQDNLGIYSVANGLIKNQNEAKLKANYLNLDKYTAMACIPDKEVLGVINYGSPVALFYSDIAVKTDDSSNFNMNIFKYLKENDMFFLTVNFANDPIGFPLTRNISAKEYERIYNFKFANTGNGFVYSKSNFVSSSNVIGAHNSYWKCPKRFAKAVVKAYVEGYTTFYPNL